MAKRKKGRPVNGILLLDKPYDMSSNHALQKAKRIYFAQKAGHTGALDPLATGMLPICFGEGTKFSQFLLDTDKTYQVTAKLGIRTTTSDADGEIVSERPVNVTEVQLAEALDKFRGKCKQVPSMYSALKYQGQPLYKIANLNTVWAEFDAYENQIASLKVGQTIKVTTNAYRNEVFDAKVSFIDPLLNSATRTIVVRAVLNNKDDLFKPGMFVEGKIEGTQENTTNKITVPATAVMWTGERSVVYVKTNPNEAVFEMR